MYLFTRRTRLTGAAGVDWAARITAKASEVGGNDVQLWGNTLSPGLGTISWTSWHADLSSLETALDKLQVDPAFQALAAEGASQTEGGFDDGVVQIVHGEPDPATEVQYVAGVQAVLSGGNAVKGMITAVEIAQRAEAVTGLQTMVGQNLTGPYGSIGWLTGYENIAALEAANNALAADPDWLALIDTTGGLFVEDPTITQQTIYRKLA